MNRNPKRRIAEYRDGGADEKRRIAKGILDIFIPSLNLWIEFKRQKGGKLSAEQAEWIEYLTHHHYSCHVCHGADQAMRLVIKFTGMENDTKN